MLVAGFPSSVYLAGVLVNYADVPLLSGYAAVADSFELLGYGIVAVFVLTWGGALLVWRYAGLERRLAPPVSVDRSTRLAGDVARLTSRRGARRLGRSQGSLDSSRTTAPMSRRK
ncbi:hypothetical protein SAMN05661080_01600 [Modestobacter sp. DSM 44400]|nr:hypothetical protein SAMN05661080_01600 [Modestobacter sp. DSM 44400]